MIAWVVVGTASGCNRPRVIVCGVAKARPMPLAKLSGAQAIEVADAGVSAAELGIADKRCRSVSRDGRGGGSERRVLQRIGVTDGGGLIPISCDRVGISAAEGRDLERVGDPC